MIRRTNKQGGDPSIMQIQCPRVTSVFGNNVRNTKLLDSIITYPGQDAKHTSQVPEV